MRYFAILALLIFPLDAFGFGAPDYHPDASHPRIFLTSTVISNLQAKVAANDPDWLTLKARADVIVARTVAAYDRTATPEGYIYYSYEGIPWLEAAQVLGLAYRATGTTTYRDKLLELGAVIAAAGNAPIIVDVGFPSRTVATAAALIYDWCYDDLGGTLKANLITAINGWYTMFYNGSDGLYIPLNGNNNYLGGHILGLGLCGIATYGDNATAASILSLVDTWWDGPVVTMFANEGQGGAILESYNYGPNHIARLLQYALALKTASGQDIYSTYSSALITNLFYNLKPNRWQSTDEGDMAGSFTGIMGLNLPLLLSSLDDSTQGNKAAYFVDHMAVPYGGDTSAIALQYVSAFDHVLFGTSKTQTDYRDTAPLNYRSPGDNHLFTRSDWTDSAVWSSFAGGAAKSTDHQQRVAGHIAIQRGNDYLLVNAGQWKGTDGVTGPPETMTQTNNNQNTLFTDGSCYASYGANYIGGQGNWGLLATAERAGATAGFGYMRAKLTSAYDGNGGTDLPGRDLIHWYRNYLVSGGSIFFLYDRVSMRATSISKELRFHLHDQSTNTNSSGVAKSVIGSSALHFKTVYPATSVLTTSTSDNEADNPVFKLTDSATSTDFNPLTVMVADASTSSAPAVTGIDTTGMLGAVVNRTVALFSKDGTDQEALTYTADATTHYIADLPVNTSIPVSRNGSAVSGSPFDTGDAGVITFSAASGSAEYAIGEGSGAPATKYKIGNSHVNGIQDGVGE